MVVGYSRSRGLLPFLMLLGVSLAARAQEAVLTPHDVARLNYVSQAVISPDGEHVAYTRIVPRIPGIDADGGAWSELHVVDVESGTSSAYVQKPNSVGALAWMPDGESITFLTRREGDATTSLYRIPLRGGEARKVVSLETSIAAYEVSADGKKIALVASEPTDPKVAAERRQGFTQEIYEEDFEARGVWIATLGDDGALVGEPRRLAIEGSVFEVAFDPSGDRLAATIAPTPLVDDSYMGKTIHVLSVADGKSIAHFAHRAKFGMFRWSPDGTKLAVISGADIHDPHAGRLFLGDATGGQLKPVDLEATYDFDEVDWIDADRLALRIARGARTTFAGVGLDGSMEWVGDRLPADFAATSFSFARESHATCMVVSRANHPPEVYFVGAGDEEPRRLTNVNPALDAKRFAKQDVFTYRARDGREIEGIFIHPLDREEGKRYPLIVVVHGGPEAHETHGWLTSYSRPGQVAAARGFAVFHPNYRGSTGRGLEYILSSQGDPAGKEFDDLVDGVKHLVAEGLVDEKKVGVTGGSYGGYASGWCATALSEHFAASVMFVGISNKISKVGTTDIPDEEFLVHARKRPWDDWQFFLERSPIYYADRCQTPLLILHGKDDPRVNVGQSRELYRHVKLRGKAPVRLVLYPGEGHGNRKAAARLDYNLRMLRWMEHYLKGEGGAPPPIAIDHAEAK